MLSYAQASASAT